MNEGNDGNAENEGGNTGNHDWNVGNQGGNARNWVGMLGMWLMRGIGVGMREIRVILSKNFSVYCFD